MKTTLQDIQKTINVLRKNRIAIEKSNMNDRKLSENWHMFITNNPQPVLNKIKNNMKAAFRMEGIKNVEEVIAELEKENNVQVQQAQSNNINEENLHVVVEVYFN